MKRQLATDVGISGDDVIVLGGLDATQATNEGAGLSFLPSWLRSQSETESKTEILLILEAKRI